MTVREFLAWGKQTCGEKFLDLEMGECPYSHNAPFEVQDKTKPLEIVSNGHYHMLAEGPHDPRAIGHYIQVCHE